ncbi:hypothetical protein COX64_04480 [Candidatus Dojkabacteria bacterium CG_4_10_14_0_2_um_filter_Dojkabacteria_WS6_41_15]|uniref:Uncharacterized protein n=1 Tax=Candidatus Dojkabacteria bacterium CG_4_10_14_0_2_um_filter_Dojkabacteria_WS6_41_15 TaxID=2014249 RepID=A0A2M7W0V0_9BACT|nr:MAG: hypothetical protein COX64_04480 [Candidatus Dojkabacteria bacterium CG_4_10_14_0_2_um_filter_Dojkabacteria_WS6_41_15]
MFFSVLRSLFEKHYRFGKSETIKELSFSLRERTQSFLATFKDQAQLIRFEKLLNLLMIIFL